MLVSFTEQLPSKQHHVWFLRGLRLLLHGICDAVTARTAVGGARHSLGPLLISFWTDDFTTGFPTQFPDHGVGCHFGEDTEVSGCHFRELRGSAGPKCVPLCRCMIFLTQTWESSLLHREEWCKSICHCTLENTFRKREVLWMTLKKEQKPMFPPHHHHHFFLLFGKYLSYLVR